MDAEGFASSCVAGEAAAGSGFLAKSVAGALAADPAFS